MCFARVCCCFGILSGCCGVGSPYPIKKEGGGGALLPFSTQKLKKVIEKEAKRVDKCGAGVVEWVVKGGGGRLCLPTRDIYIEVVRYIIIV